MMLLSPLLLPLLVSSPGRPPQLHRIPLRPSVVALSTSLSSSSSSSTEDCNNTSSDVHLLDFCSIQQVTLKPNEDDAFDDDKVSRAFHNSITQQQQQQQILGNNDDLAHAVVDYIRKNYYGSGQCMNNYYPSYYEPETYFCALYNGSTVESTTQSLFADTNGIVGIVSAQLRKRAPLIAGPSINPNNNDSSETSNVHNAPSVPLPTPHVYIANMKVDTKMQRRGIAMSLLCAVTEYTKSWCEEINENDIPMVLSVDNDNLPAINLYEKYGFTYLEQNDVFRMMIMNVVKG